MTNITALAITILLLLPAQSLHPALQVKKSTDIVLEAIEKLTPNLTAPPVEFIISAGQNDFPVLDGENALNNLLAWQIQIYDQRGKKVSYVQGRNNPYSTAIPWAGVSAEGEPLPDGFYSAKLVWIDAQKKTHITQNTSVSLFTPLEIKTLSRSKLRFDYTEEGLIVRIAENISFNQGQSKIKEEAIPALSEISRFLKIYTKNPVNIRGYSDSSGSQQRNILLSGERAEGVYRFLIKEGIDASRLTYTGLGSANPIASNATTLGKARNRRVDVVVLKTVS